MSTETPKLSDFAHLFDPDCPCESCGKTRVNLHEKHLGTAPTPLGRNVWEVAEENDRLRAELSTAREVIEWLKDWSRIETNTRKHWEEKAKSLEKQHRAESTARKEAERQVKELTEALAKQRIENAELRRQITEKGTDTQ